MKYNECKIEKIDNGLIVSATLNGKTLEELKKIIRRCEKQEKMMSKISKNYEKEIEEVAEFCETHNVLDIKTYNGNNSWEKEVVIQYK